MNHFPNQTVILVAALAALLTAHSTGAEPAAAPATHAQEAPWIMHRIDTRISYWNALVAVDIDGDG